MQWLLDGMSQLFGWLVNKLINWIVVPLLQLIILLIQYFTAGIFYSISTFLLQIIDFLEMLFRALAGLDPIPGSGSSIVFSYNGKTGGDLLIQILTSKEVIMAFEATAIVGIFLLIITTIFQMIKVEYTTEGAENNKTKIIGKSLKSLSNLLLIPVLCVFGVFIGNQVLGLIDTATKGSASAKISGTLWVTSASNALVDSRADQIVGQIFATALITTGGDFNTASAIGGVSAAIAKLGETIKGSGWGSPINSGSEEPFPDRNTVEQNFMAVEEGYAYFNIGNVVKYYNIYEVNYIVLLFGGCIILKALFHICFGLVDRLYRCIALFIVAPFVIGMSPVKDSLASWRTNFIGKALAAYGTIISMNLFFTIVTVLLDVNVDVTLMGPWATGAGDGNILVDSFYEGIVKFIFVIVGVLMIEKLAGEMGQYFGASDGLATGKSLANEVAEPAKKIAGTAVSVAAGVATGGFGFAMKAAGGIGKAVSAGRGAKAVKGGSTVDGLKDKIGQADEGLAKLDAKDSELSMLQEWKGLNNRRGNLTAEESKRMDSLKSSLGIDDSTKKKRGEVDSRIASLQKGQEKRNAERKALETQKADSQRTIKDIDSYQHSMRSAQGRKEFAERTKDNIHAAGNVALEGFETARTLGSKYMRGSMPKFLQGLQSDWKGARKEAGEQSDYMSEMMKATDKRRADRREAQYEADPVHKAVIKHQQERMAEMYGEEFSDRIGKKQEETTNQIKLLNKKLAELQAGLEKAKDNPAMQSHYINQIMATQSEMGSLGVKFEVGRTTSLDDSELQKAITDNADKFKVEADKLKAIFTANQHKSSKEIIKALEDHLAELGKTEGGDKMMKDLMKVVEELKGLIAGGK